MVRSGRWGVGKGFICFWQPNCTWPWPLAWSLLFLLVPFLKSFLTEVLVGLNGHGDSQHRVLLDSFFLGLLTGFSTITKKNFQEVQVSKGPCPLG